LERREQTRYGVRALVDFEWIDKGVPHRGRGLTRDISSKGMFIYSDSEPPAKADLQVEVSFRPPTKELRKLQLSARSLVVRVELAASRDDLRGFAILNRSYKLHNGLSAIEEGALGIEIN
jgi:PilZ domain